MKKFILAISFIFGICFMSCNKEENKPTDPNLGCYVFNKDNKQYKDFFINSYTKVSEKDIFKFILFASGNDTGFLEYKINFTPSQIGTYEDSLTNMDGNYLIYLPNSQRSLFPTILNNFSIRYSITFSKIDFAANKMSGTFKITQIAKPGAPVNDIKITDGVFNDVRINY